MRKRMVPLPVLNGAALCAVHRLQKEDVLLVAFCNHPMAAVLPCCTLLALCKGLSALLPGALDTSVAAFCPGGVYLALLLHVAFLLARTGVSKTVRGHLVMCVGIGLVSAIRLVVDVALPHGAGFGNIAAIPSSALPFLFEHPLAPAGCCRGPTSTGRADPSVNAGDRVVRFGTVIRFCNLQATGDIRIAVFWLCPVLSNHGHRIRAGPRPVLPPAWWGDGGLSLSAQQDVEQVGPSPEPLGALAILTTMALAPWKDGLTMWKSVDERIGSPFTVNRFAKKIEPSGDQFGSLDLNRLGVSLPHPVHESCLSITQDMQNNRLTASRLCRQDVLQLQRSSDRCPMPWP